MRGDFSNFRHSLLAWFKNHGRDLPWRSQPSLYRTVISEYMLQQTQVSTVLPYFERWMKRFPDFEILAEADESDVIKVWEGLGYYSRARNLLKLAKSIQSEGIPRSYRDWLERPGIGPYTAAAISSIAQGEVQPVIDGNVIRVLCRINNDDRPVASATEARRRLLPIASELIDPQAPGIFNEAIMELGATICRKNRPACLLCPVRSHCEASLSGNESNIPVITRKGARQRSTFRLWLVREDALLIHVHPQTASRLAGIAELPELPGKPETGRMLMQRKRGISSEVITESIYALDETDPLAKHCIRQDSTSWVPLDSLDSLSISAPHRRWIRMLVKMDSPN